jgi:5'-nucleotidase
VSEARNILVTNDDGIDSPGLWKLAGVMAEIGRVLVVAPAGEASGSGTMVTTRRDLHVQPVPERIPGVRGYQVDGTPADCVLVGLRQLKDGWISVVAAGINPGANMGADLFLSGTCGAALIGAFRHLTSFAISLAEELTNDGKLDPHWATGEAAARMLARGIQDGSIPEDCFLNVNVPAVPPEELRGVAVTRAAPGGFAHLKEKVDAATGRLERQIVADTRHAHPGTDIRAVLDGYVSISPLDTAMVHEAHTRRLQSAAEALSSHLAGQA